MANMVDMELDDEETEDTVQPYFKDKVRGPQYPYGLRICLTDRELKKLGLEMPEGTGEMIGFKVYACVTSVSSSQYEDGKKCERVELQIEQMGTME